MYIELAGSHANEEKDSTSNRLVSSLISARHPLDLKMKHAEMVLTEGGVPLVTGGESVRRAVPDEDGGESGREGDKETQSDSGDSSEEESGNISSCTLWFMMYCMMAVYAVDRWKLSAGTKQRARPQGNRNTRESSRKREGSVLENVETRREAEQSMGPGSADSSSEDEVGGGVECDGAEVMMTPPRRRRRRRRVLDSDDSSDGDTSADENNGYGFVEDEAEEVWSSEAGEEEMEWSGESGEEEGDEEEEEDGFVVDECKETNHHQPLVVDGDDGSNKEEWEEEGEEEEEEEEALSSDGSGYMSDSMESSGSVEEGLSGHLAWKESLAQKAKEGFERRQTGTVHLQKLIYSDHLVPPTAEGEGERKEEEGEEVGGLFRVAKREQLSVLHNEDSSVLCQTLTRDWMTCVGVVKRDLFVTGSWGEEDAAALLRGDMEEYGDFEDLETGETLGQPVEEEEEEDKRLKKKKEQKV